MTENEARPACVYVGTVGGVAVQVQNDCVSLSTSTHQSEAFDHRHVSVMTFLQVGDAAKLAELLAQVAHVHALNFAPLPVVPGSLLEDLKERGVSVEANS